MNSGSNNPVFTKLTFTKAERLCSKKIIDLLFEEGAYFLVPNFRIIHIKYEIKNSTPDAAPSKYPVQIAIAVPKKNFRRAVDRNKIKRMMREAYRKNKNTLLNSLVKKNYKIAVIFIYTSKKITSFNHIENKIKLALMRLIKDYERVE